VKIALVGPVYPYRAGIAYCTTRLAEEMTKHGEVAVISYRRQYPKRFYPGGDDIDETLRSRTPPAARFVLDLIDPITWIRTALLLRRHRPDAVVFVWWIWVWALPYRLMMALLPRSTRVALQCHNIGEKEPAWWKRALANVVFRRADALVVHAATEERDARRRAPKAKIVRTFLPVHELGGAIPSRAEARVTLGLSGNVALFFGHVRPFKALDVALRAWAKLRTPATLVVAGEAWWDSEQEYRKLAQELGLHVIPSRSEESGRGLPMHPHPDSSPSARPGMTHEPDMASVLFDFRFIPDSEIATYFAAADVVLAPYRTEAQSGVALTAFHFARPVIASTVGGLPEVVHDGENGFLVPPDDPEALGNAIDRFFASDRATMERRAADSARRYSWSEYAEVFKDLLSQ
jgi:glycosyltransferase involved in cell wall biosynthesis